MILTGRSKVLDSGYFDNLVWGSYTKYREKMTLKEYAYVIKLLVVMLPEVNVVGIVIYS